MGVFQRGNIYYIDYYASGKRVRETIGPNKKLAEKILCKRLAAVTENKHLDIRKRKKIKFSEFADQYFGEEEIRDFEDNLYNARNEDIDGDLI